MAMRTASPWWASLVFGFGLLCIFLGERLFGHVGAARVFFTGVLGLVPVLGVTALRLWTTLRTTGTRRNIERALLLCHAGTLLALVLYALTTKSGIDALGIKNVARWDGAITVLYAIVIVASLVPVLLIEISLGSARRSSIDFSGGDTDAGLDYFRVREVGWSGLTVAFALSLLFVTCQVAKERNVSRDVSYFKTSSPGESTVNIVSASTEPIKVHLFFPDTNEVKEQMLTYFERLKSDAKKVEISTHDRLAETSLATKYKVGKDGIVVISKGEGDKEKHYTIELDTDLEKMRRASGAGAKLRNFDKEVNQILMKLVREKRKAYLTVGHGEITHPESIPPELKEQLERRSSEFKRVLGSLNYETKDLGLIDLASDVPEDATLVIVAGPVVPLQPGEWATLERYLDRGGRLMVILDPAGSGTSMGALEGRLGLRLADGRLVDDRAFLPQRNTLPDRQWVITTQFSAHASTTALSRSGGKGLVMIDAGALEEIPFTSKGEAPKKTITIRTMESSWLDLEKPQNFRFDAPNEKRQRWNIAAAIEGPKVAGKDGFRALVVSDRDLFADLLIPNALGRVQPVLVSGPLLGDSIRWLGGEEVFAGEVVSEDDKPIQHTKNQDAVWFTITVVGVPLLVLALGLFGTLSRRGGRKKTSSNEEVTP